jgi:SAM-dependent methyltransferase
MARRKLWWETLFDEKYLSTYVDIVTPARTRKTLSFIERTVRLPKGAHVLDLACGYGRLSIPLALKGYRVTGVDYSKHFLEMARRESRSAGAEATFLYGNMRDLNFRDRFDAVISIFTSFGYFEKKEDDLKVLHGVKRSLRRGGRFLLDMNNALRGIATMFEKGIVDKGTGHLVARSTYRLSNGLRVRQVDRMDPASLRWRMERTWREDGRSRGYESDVRLYCLPELREMLEVAGFQVHKVFGNFNGQRYRADSDRLIVLAGKR